VLPLRASPANNASQSSFGTGSLMLRSILFGPWKDADATPEFCPLCLDQQPVFQYRLTGPDGGTKQSYERDGYCCLRCGQQLLATLEELTLAQWAEDGACEAGDAKKQEVEEKQAEKR